MSKKENIVIVGAGLSGLTAAFYLKKAGFDVTLCEAEPTPGGRVQTDLVDGHRLDRGFQVLFTEYPEAKKMLDYQKLNLCILPSGVTVYERDVHQFLDPFQNFKTFLKMFWSKSLPFFDKWTIYKLRRRLMAMTEDRIFEKFEVKTSSILKKYGFSKRAIHLFFQPFFSGIFLENDLDTSRRIFDFTFKMMASGKIAVPADGMGAISQQLVDEIGPSHFRFNARVTDVSDQGITLENGEFIPADKVILATEHNDLLQKFAHIEKVQYRSVTCLQFEAPESPLPEKMIAVNANKDALIGNFVVMSDFAPDYAPNGKSTVYVSLNGLAEMDDAALKNKVLQEIKQLTGTSVEKWKLLRTLRIPKALPFQTSVLGKRHIDSFRINDHLFVCGDHLLYGSINAAMKSGRLIAEEIIKEYKRNLHVRKGKQ